MKKLLIGLLVLVVLAVAADRVTQQVAANQVADRVQQAEHLSVRPDVTIHGFPFLTQAIRGRYGDVEAQVRGLQRGSVRITDVDVHLRDVELAASDALGGTVDAIPVRQAEARVLLAYADINALLVDRRLTVAPGQSGSVAITGSVTVLGHRLAVIADGRLRVSGDRVQVQAQNFRGNGVATGVIARAVDGKFDFTVRTPQLPFDLTLRSVTASQDGIAVAATAGPLVLHP